MMGLGLCVGWAFGVAATRAAWAVRDQAALGAALFAYVIAVFNSRRTSLTRHMHRLSQTPEFQENPTLAVVNAAFAGKFLDTKYVIIIDPSLLLPSSPFSLISVLMYVIDPRLCLVSSSAWAAFCLL
jgi:hypothetical protein